MQPKLPATLQHSLIEGARELTFEYEGWRIRCALLKASDGKEHIVREEYMKLPNGSALKKTGLLITDFERDAILQAEAGSKSWHQKLIGDIGNDPIQTLANQIAQLGRISGQVWVRDDGAFARTTGILALNLILELPQALKYEAELKAIKEREAKALVPKF